MAGPSIIWGNNLDGVYFSTAHCRQSTGAGSGVTGDVLVTHHMILNSSINICVQFPGHGESGHVIIHHHRHIDRRWRWGSWLKTKNTVKTKPIKDKNGKPALSLVLFSQFWLQRTYANHQYDWFVDPIVYCWLITKMHALFPGSQIKNCITPPDWRILVNVECSAAPVATKPACLRQQESPLKNEQICG